MERLQRLIKEMFEAADDKIGFMNELKEIMYSISPEKVNPVDRVLWVHLWIWSKLTTTIRML